jgi:heme exporter protein A
VSQADGAALLRVADLAVARGGVTLLERVGFALAPGEVLIVKGPNGIGKTTLLRTIAGLQPPLAGRIDAAEGAMAYAGHLDGVKATLSVTENLRFWARIFGTDPARVAVALAAFDIAGLAQRPAQALSAGQRRRLGLARLLVTGRPVWVLDEPTVSLDVASVALFAAAVRAHAAAGGAALLATHVATGLDGAGELDLGRFRASPGAVEAGGFDEAFL